MKFYIEIPDDIVPMSGACVKTCPFCSQRMIDGEMQRLCQNYLPDLQTCIVAEWRKANSLPVYGVNANTNNSIPAFQEPLDRTQFEAVEPEKTEEIKKEEVAEERVKEDESIDLSNNLNNYMANKDLTPEPESTPALDSPIFNEIYLPEGMVAGTKGIEAFAGRRPRGELPLEKEEPIPAPENKDSIFLQAMKNTFIKMKG